MPLPVDGRAFLSVSVRHMEGERKVNEVINVGDLKDAAEMNDAYSLDLFEI